MRQQLTAFVAMAMLIAACSLAMPAVECPTAPTRQPPNMLGCQQAALVATSALPAGHSSTVRVQFGWGKYCSPESHCPLLPPFSGFVIFALRIGDGRSDVRCECTAS